MAVAVDIINLLSSSDMETEPVVVSKEMAIDLVTTEPPSSPEEGGLKVRHSSSSQSMAQQTKTRAAMMVSYARQTGHYQAAVSWLKELEGLAASFTGGGKVPLKNEPPSVYDDSECEVCRMQKAPIKSKAWDDANEDLSNYPRLLHVFLREPPQRAPDGSTRCFSLCYVYDQEGPRSVLATSKFAILCGPCLSLRLAVLRHLVEFTARSPDALIAHWDPYHEDGQYNHDILESAAANWADAVGLLRPS